VAAPRTSAKTKGLEMIDFTVNSALAASVALLGLFAVTDAKAYEIDDASMVGVYIVDR